MSVTAAGLFGDLKRDRKSAAPEANPRAGVIKSRELTLGYWVIKLWKRFSKGEGEGDGDGGGNEAKNLGLGFSLRRLNTRNSRGRMGLEEEEEDDDDEEGRNGLRV